jgi:hypothetical protein
MNAVLTKEMLLTPGAETAALHALQTGQMPAASA